MSLLEIKGLETEFQTEQGVVKALRGINYTVDRGEVLGIVGESGSGKKRWYAFTYGIACSEWYRYCW